MCHVLLIEDDWLLADHMMQLLEAAGATSVVLVDGEEEAVRAAMVRRPAVIVSDVSLRQGHGPAAVLRIVGDDAQVRAMFVTGEPGAGRPGDPRWPVLTKPVADEVFVATFRSIAPIV
ncbi:response regulator [uncultured Sphingomonas sp.]|jgi:two-component system, response regulator PdtaR|uniref:response regulator n=1 Tax=uncultured Sphingomonas sp. TaxID=158754 RepID=UPI0030DB5D24